MGTKLHVVDHVFTKTGAGNGETLETYDNGKGYGVVLYDCGGASRTGVILEAGRVDGQHVIVTNVSDANETITFAAASTSNVASGTSMVIARYESVIFIWSETLGRWQGALGGGSTIADGAVTLAKLASGITPSHVVKFAANYTTVGGAAAEAITVTGAAATDVPLVTLQDNGTGNVTIASVAVTTNTLTVTFSGDPGDDTVISYALLRAAA